MANVTDQMGIFPREPGAPLSQRLHSLLGSPTRELELACVLPSPTRVGNGDSEKLRGAEGHSAS